MSLFGRALLLLAVAVALFTLFAAVRGRTPRNRAWYLAARRGIYGLFALFTVATATLTVALARSDFSLESVANYSSREMPFHLRVTALWASQAGSLLFWGWLLTMFASIAVYTNRKRNHELMPIVVAVLAFLGLFFAGVLTFVTSPFETMAVVPENGRGLMSALRNPYMVSHPPTLYLGYVSIAIPFAFAIAALVTRRLDSAWIASIRRWTLASWTFLGIGIILGAKWAYESLSFGGYWIWDPVENAAFLPWLTGTAFLHSIMVQERRGMLKIWNMALIIGTFALTMFGTLLTRSSIVNSVHNFGAQTVGTYLLGMVVLTIAVGIYLIVTRLPELRSEHSLESYFSREAIFLYNNLLLIGLAFIVVWGTLYPVMSELIQGERITVGRGFFDQVAAPIGVALLLFTGLGPLVPWRRASWAQIRTRFLWPTIVAVVAVPLLLLFTDSGQNWAVTLTLMIAVFTMACIGSEFVKGAKVRHALGGVSWVGAVRQLISRNRRRYGGYIVHVGIVVVIVGIACSRAFLSEGTFQLRQGESASAGGYIYTVEKTTRARTDEAMTVTADVRVTRPDGSFVTMLRPKEHVYRSNMDVGNEIAISSGPTRDIWMNLAGVTEDGVASLHVFVNPMVSWLWAGGLIFLLGAVVAGWPSGRRERAPASVPATGDEAKA